METKAYGIQSPESLAKEYGGNKQKIAKAVQLGILDPTAAVLAGMFIDRVRNAAQEEQGPQTTVAQQVLGGPPPAPPQGPPPGPPQAGLQAAAPPPTRLAYGGQVGVSNNQVPEPAMERGLAGIPVPDNMFDYAGGGMVAFAGGGDVQRFQNQGAVRVGQPNDLRLAGFTWDQLPVEDSGMYGPITRGISELFSRPMNQRKKRDPNTGEYITYSEFIERAAQPQRGAMPQNMSPDMQKYLQQFERGRETMTAPPGADATGRPNIDPFVAAKQNVLTRESAGVAGVGGASGAGRTSFAPRSMEDILRSIQGESGGETAEQYGRRVGQLNVEQAGFVKPEAPLTPKKAIEKVNEADIAAGVDPKFFEKLQGRIDTMREEAKTDKSEAANLRLLEAGLGILGGTSPYAFVNIGKGASEAVKGFGQDLKDYQKARRELDKAAMDLQSAEQTAARTKSAKALDMVDKSETRFENATNKVAEAKLTATNSATNAFIGQEQIKSGERRTAAEIGSRDRQIAAQLAQSDRQIAESRAARLEALNLSQDQKFVEGLTKAEQAATSPYDARIKVVETALSNPTAALTPNFIKEQQAKIDELIAQRTAAADLARAKYIDARRTGRPTQNNAALSAADRIAGIGR